MCNPLHVFNKTKAIELLVDFTEAIDLHVFVDFTI